MEPSEKAVEAAARRLLTQIYDGEDFPESAVAAYLDEARARLKSTPESN